MRGVGNLRTSPKFCKALECGLMKLYLRRHHQAVKTMALSSMSMSSLVPPNQALLLLSLSSHSLEEALYSSNYGRRDSLSDKVLFAGFVKGVLPSTTPWSTFLIRPYWHAPCLNKSYPNFRCFAYELTPLSPILNSESEDSPTPKFLTQINGDQKLVVTPASCEDLSSGLGPNTAFKEGYRQACVEAAHAAYREDKTE
jgi:hypothetical protein